MDSLLTLALTWRRVSGQRRQANASEAMRGS
jgi:hypothetical protein